MPEGPEASGTVKVVELAKGSGLSNKEVQNLECKSVVTCCKLPVTIIDILTISFFPRHPYYTLDGVRKSDVQDDDLRYQRLYSPQLHSSI